MKTGKRLTLTFGLVLLLATVFAVLLFWAIQRLFWERNRLGYAYSQAACIERIATRVNQQLKDVSDYIASGDEKELEEFEESKDKVLLCFNQWEELINQEVLFVTEHEDEIEEKEFLTSLRQQYFNVLGKSRQALSINKSGENVKANKFFEEIIEDEYNRKFSSTIEDVIEQEQDEITQVIQSGEKFHTFVVRLSLAISGVVLISIIFLTILTTRNIAVPIKKLTDATIEVGKGNLDVTIDVKSKDEIGQLAVSFGTMTQSLKKSMTSIENLNHEITERKRAEIELKATQLKIHRENTFRYF